MKQEVKKEVCKNCKNWRPKQSELEYDSFYGICTSHIWQFRTTDQPDICILDRQNLTDKHMHVNRFENQNANVPIGVVNKSRYCFVTNENFGCINFE